MGFQGGIYTSATVVLSTPTLVKRAVYYPSLSSSIVLAFSYGANASTTTSISLTWHEAGAQPHVLMENKVATYFQIVGMVGGVVHVEIA